MADKERLAEYANDIRNNLSEIIDVLQDRKDLTERVQELEKRCHYLNNELFRERTIKNEFQQGIEEQGKRIKELEMGLEQIKEMAGLIDRKYFEVADKALRGKQNA
ncbi:hypothetical protein CAI16_02995 [Virgibacillus dokdonensis]|uniref:Uncharacterized protein n=1 Tax=Virgibacillus dokdonensis TaxID=302167 RepID=A0A3E0WYJ3_9BACI|nr:hypothetical protein [Virgibacillus dokdonensis]RFA37055.1 hypothetical protein CAI16_02995 [Virgibacillus dokdonensis]